jgi:short-subunit dehydrogenase
MILKDKVVIITGGSKGLGLELAKQMKEKGAKIIISSRDRDNLEKVAVENNFDFFVCDVTNEVEVKSLSNYVLEKNGGYDIWINNAGIMTRSDDFLDTKIEDIKKMFDVNFFGYYACAKVALKHFVDKNSGVLLNINSSSALEGKKDIIGYSSSKYAVKGLTDGLEKYLSAKNVLQINVYPGGIKTDLHRENNPASFGSYFEADYVAKIIVENLEKEDPEKELKILRNK